MSYPVGGNDCRLVSLRVGTVKNNNPSLIEPVAVGIDAVAQPRIGAALRSSGAGSRN